MLDDQVSKEIAQSLLSAGATANTVNEVPPLDIRDMAPYPALFRAEMKRLFGIRLLETDLDLTIDELASLINSDRAGRS
jgi:hypothetical protein